jgi:hypothetical protein
MSEGERTLNLDFLYEESSRSLKILEDFFEKNTVFNCQSVFLVDVIQGEIKYAYQSIGENK